MHRTFLFWLALTLGWTACTGDGERPLCGNGDLNYGEDCDGEYYSPRVPYTCAMLGYNSPGRPVCTSACKFDPAPCVESGSCGDGFWTPGWEECDGKDNAGQTCESLGHHAGRLFCHEDCTFDVSQCLRCGDGVLQPEYGELFESGPQYCLDTGHLGGLVFTDDCVTPMDDRCGEYALVPAVGSLLEPVVALGPGEEIFLRGLTTGAFPGFTHPRTECPVLTEITDREQFPAPVVGWRHDPACAQEFLAVRPPGQVERVLDERPVDGQVLSMQDLGDGWIALRLRQEIYELVRLDAAGAEVAVHPVLMDGPLQPPRLLRLPGGEAVLATLDDTGLHLWTVEPATGEPVQRLVLRGVILPVPEPSQIPQFGEYPIRGLLRLTRLGPEEWLIQVYVHWGEYQGLNRFLHVRDEGGDVQVKVLEPDVYYGSAIAISLEPDETSGGGVLTWARGTKSQNVSRSVFNLEGEVIASYRLNMPSGTHLEALGSDGAGGVLVFGTVPVYWAADLWRPTCPGAERAFAFWHLGPDLQVLDARFFPSIAANMISANDPDYCAVDEQATDQVDDVLVHAVRRSYDFRDGTLLVSGAYDTAVGFCDEGEAPRAEDDLPVHACGLYLLRFR